MNRFCPVCGNSVSIREIETLGSCSTCHASAHPLFQLDARDLFIQVCPTCFKFKDLHGHDKTWNVPSFKTYKDVWIQAIYYYIVSHIKNHDELDFTIEFTRVPDVLDAGRKKPVGCILSATPRAPGREGEVPPSLAFPLALVYSVGSCDDCALKRVGYHNSVVQVRTGSRRAGNDRAVQDVVDEIIRFSKDSSYHGLDPIASIEDVPGGKDVKLLSKKFGSVVVHHLKKNFCIDVKESFKVIKPDKETGGNLKRMFYGVRLHPVTRGDIVTSARTGDPCLVVKMGPEMLLLVSLETGNEEHVKPGDVSDDSLLIKAGEPGLSRFHVISVDLADKSATLMHQDTFEEAVVALNPWHGGEQDGDVVLGFFHEGTLLVIPRRFAFLVEPGGLESGC